MSNETLICKNCGRRASDSIKFVDKGEPYVSCCPERDMVTLDEYIRHLEVREMGLLRELSSHLNKTQDKPAFRSIRGSAFAKLPYPVKVAVRILVSPAYALLLLVFNIVTLAYLLYLWIKNGGEIITMTSEDPKTIGELYQYLKSQLPVKEVSR